MEIFLGQAAIVFWGLLSSVPVFYMTKVFSKFRKPQKAEVLLRQNLMQVVTDFNSGKINVDEVSYVSLTNFIEAASVISWRIPSANKILHNVQEAVLLESLSYVAVRRSFVEDVFSVLNNLFVLESSVPLKSKNAAEKLISKTVVKESKKVVRQSNTLWLRSKAAAGKVISNVHLKSRMKELSEDDNV